MTNTARVIFWVMYITTVAAESTYKAGKFCAPYIKQFYAYVLENAPYWWIRIEDASKIAKPYVIQATAVTIAGAQWVWDNREMLRERAAQPFVYRSEVVAA